jgi:hypothetical protein
MPAQDGVDGDLVERLDTSVAEIAPLLAEELAEEAQELALT